LEFYKRDFFISRIISGYIPITIDKKRFKIYGGNNNVNVYAKKLYIEFYDKAVNNGLLEDFDIYELLICNGIWTEEDENNLKEVLPKHIEYWKKELYQSVLKSNTRDSIRKYLAKAKEEYNRLYNIRHLYDHMTCAGFANYVKKMFTVSKTTKYRNKPVDWKCIDLNKVMYFYHKNLLDSDNIRMLSRTSPWNSFWPALKINGRIFKNTYLTDEQQSLISWSLMYDKIHDSIDCPSDEIINDDDMLDGWLLIQKEKREKEKKKSELENVTNSKIGNADDVFIMAETLSDAKNINLLNDHRGSKIKKQRLQQIDKDGIVPEQRLKDVQQKQRMLLQQAYTQQVKGK
jgi:hypothetical protein